MEIRKVQYLFQVEGTRFYEEEIIILDKNKIIVIPTEDNQYLSSANSMKATEMKLQTIRQNSKLIPII